MIKKRSFYGGLLVISALIVAISIYIYRIPGQQAQQGQWVNHTHEVLGHLEALSANLIHTKSTHHDYVQFRSPADYQKYQELVAHTNSTLGEIETLIQDNPDQQSRIKPLRTAITNYLARYTQDMDPQLASPQTVPLDSARAEAEAIASAIGVMRAEENKLLKERIESWQSAVERTRLFFLGGIVVLYIFIVATYIITHRDARLRERMLEIESQASLTNRSLATHLSQIVEIQQAIASQRLNLQKAMDVITKRTQQITQADGAVIEMLEGDNMVYRAGSGNMAPHVGFSLKAQGSLSGLCVEQAQSLHCTDSEIDDRVDKEACRKVGVRSMVVVPLMQGRETVGVLKVASANPNHFDGEDTGTLQLMAGLLSATLRDAVESEGLKDSNQSLNMKNELLKSQKAQLESDKVELTIRADTDGMTGLKNYRYFEEKLEEEFLRSKRYNNALSVILIDVDHFKAYNDSYGHPAGDAVLRQIASILKNSARPSDCVARYGGEEFAILLPQTNINGAAKAATRIRQAILDAPWEHRRVTVSMGISEFEQTTPKAIALVDEADKALYQSKMAGRDRIMQSTKAA